MLFEEHVPFRTSIFSTNIEFDPAPIISKIKEIQDSTPSLEFSNRGGWQSPTYKFESLSSELAVVNPIFDVIGNEMVKLYEVYGIDRPVNLLNFWFNVNKRYNYNVSHTHQFSFFSGAVYFKVPKNSGNIVFERPDNSKFVLPGVQNDRNWSAYYIDPTVINTVVFPSYLSHHVEQNLTEDEDDERISMAFNFG